MRCPASNDNCPSNTQQGKGHLPFEPKGNYSCTLSKGNHSSNRPSFEINTNFSSKNRNTVVVSPPRLVSNHGIVWEHKRCSCNASKKNKDDRVAARTTKEGPASATTSQEFRNGDARRICAMHTQLLYMSPIKWRKRMNRPACTTMAREMRWAYQRWLKKRASREFWLLTMLLLNNNNNTTRKLHDNSHEQQEE